MSVSTNIKRLRKSNKLTQDNLAEKMHVTRQAISNWETGKNQPDIETLELLATIFGTDISELIYGNKKGCYPRYQRKYVIYVGVCLLAIIAFVIIRVFGLPYFQEFLKKSYDIGFVGVILNYTSCLNCRLWWFISCCVWMNSGRFRWFTGITRATGG